MEAILYTEFSKRRNSTKNPTSPSAVSVGVTKNVTLKENCSLLYPKLFIADTNGYVYMKFMGWYYFIKDSSYDINGAHYIECEIDVLGTWRDVILATSAFVRYSTIEYNTRIPDTRISTLTGVSITHYNNLISEIYQDNTMWEYYLCVLSESGIDHWLLTQTEMRFLMNELVQNGSSIWGSLTTQMEDALACLLKCRICPIAETAFSGSREGEYVKLGEYTTGVTAFHLNSPFFNSEDFVDVTVPSDFRIIEPYTYCKVTLPFVGVIDLSLDELYGVSKLYFSMSGNASTGKITYRLFRDNHSITSSDANVIGEYNGEFGCDIPIGGQEMQNPIGTIAGMASMAAMALNPNPVSVSSAINATRQAYMGMQKTTSMVGGFGGNGGWAFDRRLKVELFSKNLSENPDNMLALYGRPLDAVRNLSLLSGGYVETDGFSIDISAPSTVKDMINNFMDTGVYLE